MQDCKGVKFVAWVELRPGDPTMAPSILYFQPTIPWAWNASLVGPEKASSDSYASERCVLSPGRTWRRITFGCSWGLKSSFHSLPGGQSSPADALSSPHDGI